MTALGIDMKFSGNVRIFQFQKIHRGIFDVNRIVFSEAKVNQGLPDSLFHFAPPQGAYVQEF